MKIAKKFTERDLQKTMEFFGIYDQIFAYGLSHKSVIVEGSCTVDGESVHGPRLP